MNRKVRICIRAVFGTVLSGVAVSLVLVSAAGCASSNDRILSDIIAQELQLAQAGAVPDAGSNGGPDMPAQPLPPRRVAEAQVTVQPESIVQITVEEDPSLDGAYEVNGSSAIEFGYVGLVFLNDLSELEAEQKVETTLQNRGFKAATVDLKIVKASYDKVRVTGAVMAPSTLKIGPGSSISLEEALRRAAGLRPQAKGVRVRVVRQGILSPFGIASDGEDYSLLDASGKPSVPKIFVRNNDWVHVFPGADEVPGALGEKTILVLGEVDKPGAVTFTSSEPCTMFRLMLKMGGLPKWASESNILIIRKDENGKEQKIKADIRELMKYGDPEDDVALENGDRIIIKERRLLF